MFWEKNLWHGDEQCERYAVLVWVVVAVAAAAALMEKEEEEEEEEEKEEEEEEKILFSDFPTPPR